MTKVKHMEPKFGVPIRVGRIDRVHLEVSDRENAAKWYGRVLRLKEHIAFGARAGGSMCPLIIEAGDSCTELLFFVRKLKDVSQCKQFLFKYFVIIF